MATTYQHRSRAAAAAAKAKLLCAELDDTGRADGEDDADAQARGLEALAAMNEAIDAFVRTCDAVRSRSTTTARAQADRAERALARVQERLGLL